MLKSFRVRNFRCFREFEVHNLARINLVVGDNNTGKTVLLEALFSHLVQANIVYLLRLKAFRGMPVVLDETLWRDLFNDFQDFREIQLLSVDEGGRNRESKITLGQPSEISVTAPPASGATTGTQSVPIRRAPSFRSLRVEYRDGVGTSPFANEVVLEPTQKAVRQLNEFTPDLPAHFFSTAGIPDQETTARHLSELIVAKKDADLVSLGKVIDKRIKGLSVASPTGTSEVFVDWGQEKLVQLTLLGSGMVRAIGIGSAIAHNAGGVILVDEIETGIYYSRFAKFWKVLSDVAKKYGTQIVASTHSSECVKAAIESVGPDLADSDPLRVYKLLPGRSEPIPYERESLVSAMEFMAEVR